MKFQVFTLGILGLLVFSDAHFSVADDATVPAESTPVTPPIAVDPANALLPVVNPSMICDDLHEGDDRFPTILGYELPWLKNQDISKNPLQDRRVRVSYHMYPRFQIWYTMEKDIDTVPPVGYMRSFQGSSPNFFHGGSYSLKMMADSFSLLGEQLKMEFTVQNADGATRTLKGPFTINVETFFNASDKLLHYKQFQTSKGGSEIAVDKFLTCRKNPDYVAPKSSNPDEVTPAEQKQKCRWTFCK